MGNKISVKKVGFEDVQYILKSNRNHIIMSTLSDSTQECIIRGTISPDNEVSVINKSIGKNSLYIIIYGRNCTDETVYEKYHSLLGLGFTNVWVYPGGLFEWLCLQDIYGEDNFPTTSTEVDILKYKPDVVFNTLFLTDIDY
jgi:hypothetical protein